MWFHEHAFIKNNKVVVKLKHPDGTFKESCIMPTVMYPLNKQPEVFHCENAKPVTDKKLLELFDTVDYHVGHCYQNAYNLAECLKANGYDAKTYVGWLFVSQNHYPIHHCWVVVNEHVLDISDDFSNMLSRENIKNFACSIDEQREMLASFRAESLKFPNSVRCAVVGQPTNFLFYVGCECEPEEGRLIYRNLVKTYPNHPAHKNVGEDNLNPTQRLLKEKGLM